MWNGSSLGGVFAQRANAFRPGVLADARATSRASIDGPGRSSTPRSQPDLSLEDLLADGRMVARVRRLVPRPARRRDLVGQPGDVHPLPGRAVRPVLRQPRAASPARLASVAHRPGRCPPIRGRDRPAAGASSPDRHADREDRPRATTMSSSTSPRSGPETFDHVIVATHSDQALALLERPVPRRARDPRCLPIPAEHRGAAHRCAACSRRCGGPGRAGTTTVPSTTAKSPTVTYHMNRLQNLASRHEICLTLNRTDEISARASPRDDRVPAPGLRPRSDRAPSSGTPRSAAATEPPTAAPTGDTASTRTASRARDASAPSWECAREQRDLRRQRLSPPVPARSPRVHAAGRAPAARPRRDRRRCARSIRSGRVADRTQSGSVARDFYGPSHQPLAEAVRDLVEGRPGPGPTGPVRMLAHLRTWGWLFNPIACYWCWDAGDRAVQALVADVTSTPWHGRHAYVVERPGGRAMVRQAASTCRRSSPWTSATGSPSRTPGDGRGADREPSRRRDWSSRPGSPLDDTRFHAATLGRMLWRYPMLTARASAASTLEAARLAAKGVPFHRTRRARWRSARRGHGHDRERAVPSTRQTPRRAGRAVSFVLALARRLDWGTLVIEDEDGARHVCGAGAPVVRSSGARRPSVVSRGPPRVRGSRRRRTCTCLVGVRRPHHLVRILLRGVRACDACARPHRDEPKRGSPTRSGVCAPGAHPRPTKRPGALRLLQRLLRPDARPDDDLLVRGCSSDASRLSPTRSAASSTGSAASSTSDRTTRWSRSAPAGAASPSTPPPTTDAGSPPRRSQPRSSTSPASGWPRPGSRTSSPSDPTTTATSAGRYTKLASIEMIEAVDWRDHDDVLRHLLAPARARRADGAAGHRDRGQAPSTARSTTRTSSSASCSPVVAFPRWSRSCGSATRRDLRLVELRDIGRQLSRDAPSLARRTSTSTATQSVRSHSVRRLPAAVDVLPLLLRSGVPRAARERRPGRAGEAGVAPRRVNGRG